MALFSAQNRRFWSQNCPFKRSHARISNVIGFKIDPEATACNESDF